MVLPDSRTSSIKEVVSSVSSSLFEGSRTMNSNASSSQDDSTAIEMFTLKDFSDSMQSLLSQIDCSGVGGSAASASRSQDDNAFSLRDEDFHWKTSDSQSFDTPTTSDYDVGQINSFSVMPSGEI